MSSKTLLSAVKAKSPIILLTLGCIGVAATAVSAVFDKERYDSIIEDVKAEKEETKEEIKKTDVIKVVAKSYWRTAAIGIFSICCIIASNRISASQLATVGAAYAASENKRKEFMAKATEKLGDKKVEEIKNSITDEKIQKTFGNDNVTIINTGCGEQLFYDEWTGSVFTNDMETVRKGINDANIELRNTDELTYNEWRSFISNGKLDDVDSGKTQGWTTAIVDKIEVAFTPIKIKSGPYKDRVAMGIRFYDEYEPKTNIRY